MYTTPAMKPYAPQESCPKCGSASRKVKYNNGWLGDTPADDVPPHLWVTCQTCGYFERRATLDDRGASHA